MNQKKRYYKLWLKKPWTYIVGAVLISLLQIVTLAITGSPLGVSTGFTNWGVRLCKLVDGNVDTWYYFSSRKAQVTFNNSFFNDSVSIRNLGIIFGALLSTLLASQFRIKKIKSIKQIIGATLGGLLMGYGARIALGCNIGALYSGIASLSLSGWVYALFLFLGAIVGSKVLVKYFM